VTADAFPGRTFSAEITTIEPQISADTRTMTIQATMPNRDNALLPGMFVNAAVVLPPQPDMMVLPETAVDYTLYGDSVYVIREDGKDAKGNPILKAVRTPVKTGTRWGNKVTILDGLNPGASPDLMQGFITTPISQAVSTAEGIDYLTASSIQGTSTVTAYIRLNYDPSQALTDIMAKVQQVKFQLPKESQDPVIIKST